LYSHHREWIIYFVLKKDPLSYLIEIKREFEKVFHFDVSVSTISRILKEEKITKKVLERRAMEIRADEIYRYSNEINIICPIPGQLLFLDEMSTDSRSMLRKKGWFLRNMRPFFRGIFHRSSRISILAFLGVDGLVECYETEGTFDRQRFVSCVRSLLKTGKIQKYPGKHSVWVMDGASIHLSADLIGYVRSVGIKVVFLPAYCPFFNPIEIMFGLIKRKCQLLYKKKGTELIVLLTVLKLYCDYDFFPIFSLCGYSANGTFDPKINTEAIHEAHGDEEDEGKTLNQIYSDFEEE
jgi:hypothetical protein